MTKRKKDGTFAPGGGGGNPGNRWAKGQSGNPGGRPKKYKQFVMRAREAVDEYVIDMWINEVMTQGDLWMEASKLLAAYGYGKPTQRKEISGPDGGPMEVVRPEDLTDEQLAAIVAGKL